MTDIELVIFDCDGVLVDSEIVAAEVGAGLLARAGYPIEATELAERYAGLTWKAILLEIEREAGIPFSASLIDEEERIVDERLKREARVIDGAAKAVAAVRQPKCVCSNSTGERLKLSLKKIGLYEAFAPNVFSAVETGSKKGKPAPDIFLHAAEIFGINPANTVVIEDSVHGVTGAKVAGMRVIGFTGGSHCYPGHGDKLMDAGAETVINRHRDLAPVIEALSLWSEAV